MAKHARQSLFYYSSLSGIDRQILPSLANKVEDSHWGLMDSVLYQLKITGLQRKIRPVASPVKKAIKHHIEALNRPRTVNDKIRRIRRGRELQIITQKWVPNINGKSARDFVMKGVGGALAKVNVEVRHRVRLQIQASITNNHE